jgi:hypothetical protein
MAAVARTTLAIVLLATSFARAQDGASVPAPPRPEPPVPVGVPIPTAESIAKNQQDAPETSAPTPPLPPPSTVRAAWLAREPLLQDIPFRSETHFDPVEVLVQPPTGGDDAHVQRVAWTYGTWCRALHVLFESRYALPARRVALPDHESLVIVVLTQPATFAALRTAAGARDVQDDAAFYDSKLPAVVLLDPEPPPAAPVTAPAATGAVVPPAAAPPSAAPRKPTRPAPPVRLVLHAAVHALLDAYGEPGKPLPLWLAEGLAQQLSSHADTYSDDRPSLAVFDDESLHSLALSGLDRTQRIACVRPLAEMTNIVSFADLDRLAAGLPVPAELPLQGLARESGLLLAWLDDPSAHRTPYGINAVVQWLAGHGGGHVLVPAMPDAMQGDFVSWTQEQIARRVKLGTGAFTLQPEVATLEELRPGVLAQPADLALPPASVELERARALQLAARGDLAGAAARCKELAARADATPADAAALKTDARLLPALDELRHRWAAAHANKLLDFHDGDVLLRTTLVRVDGEQLVVKDKGKERSLPMTALVPAVLAAQLVAPGSGVTGPDDETRAYAWLIAPDPDWKDKTVVRLRKDSAAAALALVDQRASYETALATGRGLLELEAVAGAALPLAGASESERDAWLARVKPAFADRAVPVVTGCLPVLRSLSRRVLGGRFDLAPLAHLPLRGKLEDLGHDRLRVSWHFVDASELADWEARPFDAEVFGAYPDLPTTPTPEGLAVENGQLVARGSGDWRCKLPFAAPLTLDYDLRYGFTPEEQARMDAGEDAGEDKLVEGFALRVCADDYGNGLNCAWFGHLIAVNKLSGGFEAYDTTIDHMLMDKRSHLRLEHDGQRIRVLLDGQEVSSGSVLKRVAGGVDIWHHTQRPIWLDNVVVEGALDRTGLQPVRDAWVASQLAALGGGD